MRQSAGASSLQIAHRAPFDAIAIGASAGGQVATAALLRDLPPGFLVPIIVMQHLGPQQTNFAEVYRKIVPMPVEMAEPGDHLQPGRVVVCPPRSFVEVLPNGSLALSAREGGSTERPIDRLFDSLARSFGERAIAVVLTGMGDDGAAGARQLHLAGGRVLVQSEASAEHPDMPRAAIRAGAADLVVPLADLGQVLGEVVAGTPRPQARSERDAVARVFGYRGEVAAQAREVDWSRTPLGPVIGWPADLRLIVRTAMDAPYMMAVWWGPELIQLYNDAWRQLLGDTKHPQALGGRARATWLEIWHDIGPMVEHVMTHGEAVSGESSLILIDRHGFPEEVFITFAYSPIRDARGAVVGVNNTGWDVTRNVVSERRGRALRYLAAWIASATTPREACELSAEALASDPADLPFALIYMIDEARRQATLCGAAGLEPGSPAAPRLIDLASADGSAHWPLQQAHERAVLVEDLNARFPGLSPPPGTPPGTWPPRSAILLPLRPAADKPRVAVLIVGLSPHRPLDDDYHGFLDLVVEQVNAGLTEARARQLERERVERIAELDRAKAEFFANVSHEFRTPLTLLLAPLEDLLDRRAALPPALVQDIDVAARNARKLLGLVNNLLDFSQIEQRRHQALLEAADLCAITSDVASAFRSAIEAAGLRLLVDCAVDLPPVPINRDMWEKVVSNLLSNALKFTFEGEISVTLRALSRHAELCVTDTGVGIPAEELPNIFKRFHRVRGARARTAEGSGIGLSLVDDLVRRMGGQIHVRSTEGRGTNFTIWMPYKTIRQPVAEPVGSPAGATLPGTVAADLASEALRWLAGTSGYPEGVADDLLGPPAGLAMDAKRGRLVVVDDSADMRDYLRRLLAPRWDVETAADGGSALTLVRRMRPDIVLADVLMPGLDGFALLKQIRDDADLKYTPVVLLTARAGEEAAIEGLLAGADDYIAKPFSARELMARVRAAADRARAEAALRESEEQFRALVNASSDVVYRMSPDWSEMRALLGKGFLADTAAPNVHWLAEYIHPDDQPEVLEKIQHAIATKSPFEFEHRVLRADGTLGWTFSRAVPIFGAEAEIVEWFGAAGDVTQRKEAEEALADELGAMSRLHDLADRLLSITDLKAALGEVLDATLGLFGADRGTLQIHDPEAGALRYAVWRGFDEEALSAVPSIDRDFHSTCAVVIRTGQRVVAADIPADPRWADHAPAAAALGYKAAISSPMKTRREELQGVLTVHFREPYTPTDRELRWADLHARLAAHLVERGRAEAALREREGRLSAPG